MATVTLTYVIRNVPAGKCTSVFSATGPNGAIGPVTTNVDVLSSMVDAPTVTVASIVTS